LNLFLCQISYLIKLSADRIGFIEVTVAPGLVSPRTRSCL